MEKYTLPINSEEDIIIGRQKGRLFAQQLGFGSTDCVLVATAISEVTRNIIKYAGAGELTIETTKIGQRQGLTITAADQGPGIADIALAMRDGYSTSGGLGMGLPGAKRLMDDFTISSEVGKGTTIVMKKWLT